MPSTQRVIMLALLLAEDQEVLLRNAEQRLAGVEGHTAETRGHKGKNGSHGVTSEVGQGRQAWCDM